MEIGSAAAFEKLEVWQRGIALVGHIYRVSRAFPREEQFGLTAQIRRAAVSVPSNIAEGHARNGRREFERFVSNAQGSLAEVYTQLQIASDLEFIAASDARTLIAEIRRVARMLDALRQSLISNLQSPHQ